MVFKRFSPLPEEARSIRECVFVREQGFCEEFDEKDKIAVHIVAYDEKNHRPVAVCRIFESDDGNAFVFGRLAVLKEYRGRGIGAEMMREAEAFAVENGAAAIILHAQCSAEEFYKKQGYIPSGKPDTEDEGCLHIWMKKKDCGIVTARRCRSHLKYDDAFASGKPRLGKDGTADGLES